MFYRSKHELQGRHMETGLSFGETETRPCRETGLDAALGPSRRRAQEERAAISLNGSLSSAQKRKYGKVKEDDHDLAAVMRRVASTAYSAVACQMPVDRLGTFH